MSIVSRGVNFLKRYLFSNPLYVLTYAMVFWRKGFSFSVNLLSEQETTKQLREGRSLIRLGDGEISLILGLRNHYQKFSPILQKAIFNIVHTYNNNSSYILSVPRFINCTNDELHKMGKFHVWLPLKVIFLLYFNKKVKYLDAHSFYYDGYFERVVTPAIKDKHVVLITKQETITFQRNNQNLLLKNISYISVPSEESLSFYEIIVSDIEAIISVNDKKNLVLLFAMGPVGKLLAFEFDKKGIQSIDIGKVAEVMYTGTSIEYII